MFLYLLYVSLGCYTCFVRVLLFKKGNGGFVLRYLRLEEVVLLERAVSLVLRLFGQRPKFRSFIDKLPFLVLVGAVREETRLIGMNSLSLDSRISFDDCFSPVGEWAELAGTAIASQPVGRAEQAPNCIPSSKNQGDNRRPSRDGPSCHTEKNRYYT